MKVGMALVIIFLNLPNRRSLYVFNLWRLGVLRAFMLVRLP